MTPEHEPEPDDETMEVRRCAHINLDDDAAEVSIGIDLSWPAGMPPETLKGFLKKATDKAFQEATFLA